MPLSAAQLTALALPCLAHPTCRLVTPDRPFMVSGQSSHIDPRSIEAVHRDDPALAATACALKRSWVWSNVAVRFNTQTLRLWQRACSLHWFGS